MLYRRSVGFLFANPRWWALALAGGVSLLVPFVGPIVFMGYLSEMIERFHRTRRDEVAEFDLNRLMDYLKRGLWPFLAAFIAGMVVNAVLMPVFFLLFSLSFGVGAAAGGEEGAATGFLIGQFLFFLALPLVGLVLSVFTVPLLLGGALGRSLGAAFSWGFIRSFAGKMWVETLLSMLFIWLVGLAATVAGALLCCVGVYPAMALVMAAQWHLYWQLYELYLARGGAPIPLPAEDGKPPLGRMKEEGGRMDEKS